jgi:hypothetical protein
MRVRDKKTKEAFAKFLKKNPDFRFWQAIYAFTKSKYIYTSLYDVDNPNLKDVFFVESDEELEKKEEA